MGKTFRKVTNAICYIIFSDWLFSCMARSCISPRKITGSALNQYHTIFLFALLVCTELSLGVCRGPLFFRHTNFRWLQEREGRYFRFLPNYHSIDSPWNSPDQIFICPRNLLVLQNFQGQGTRGKHYVSKKSSFYKMIAPVQSCLMLIATMS